MSGKKRHLMMQNLFGDQSEEEEDEDAPEEEHSEHESNHEPPNYTSDEEVRMEPHGDGEGEVIIEEQGEVEVVSEGEIDAEPNQESGEERAQSSQEVEVDDQREVSEEEYAQRVVPSRRREVVESESERSEGNHYDGNEDEEVDQDRRSPGEEDGENNVGESVVVHEVFGDSDDEEPDYAVQHDIDEDPNRSPAEEDPGSYGKGLQPEDMLIDEDAQYESEEERFEAKGRERPVGSPLELEIPLRSPPAHPDKMNLIKVSNIMGVDPKPFDPKTFQEEDVFVTDESGSRKRIRLDNNIVRWRIVKNKNGSKSYESNARFVRWSDGSLQLLIGNEVLDISVQDMQHDQAHLFFRHGKGILQSQGRLLRKMKFMPSSLTSNSHRLLTALVDSRHKKVYKVKNCITDIDPEREKEEKEKALSQTIRANALLSRKREKVSRKYTQTVDRGRQLSPGFLEDALDEEDEPDYYESRNSRRRFDEDMEVEARAEKRIINAKKGHKDIPHKPPMSAVKSSRRPVDFSDSEKGESEYESEEYERSPPRKRGGQEYEEELEESEPEAKSTSDEAEEPTPKRRESGGLKRKAIESDEESPLRKASAHRRKALVYDSDED